MPNEKKPSAFAAFRKKLNTPKVPPEPQEAEGVAPPIAGQPATLANITDETVREIATVFKDYKEAKNELDQRIIDNEEWFRLRHWERVRRSKNPNDPEPVSAHLQNVILNKHAAAMDAYPEYVVTPREAGDEAEAKLLNAILPVILEQNNYEQVYSDKEWYKAKIGGGIVGYFWNTEKLNGLGDIDIRCIDPLNLYWEPGIRDIQRSRNVFHVDLMDADLAREIWPEHADKFAENDSGEVPKYAYDKDINTARKLMIVDWYYKVRRNGRTLLHFCKFCQGVLLYASENDPALVDRGFYDHGQYPFVIDSPIFDVISPIGPGYIDQNKSAQIYIDKLDQGVLKHSMMATHPRFICKGDTQINLEEFADWDRAFIKIPGATGDVSGEIMPITVPVLPPIYEQIRQNKILELKETSGNRDFNQGGTTGGVTAASAVAALQEAGSKLDRDASKSAYRSDRKGGYLIIELMRQFYKEPRWFRIVGEQQAIEYKRYTNAGLQPRLLGNDFNTGETYRIPTFDISVKAQKASPFSTVAQNERAKEFFGMGFFRPDMADQALACLEMMSFEGKEKVMDTIRKNGTLYTRLQQVMQLSALMAAELDRATGSQYTPQVMQAAGISLTTRQPSAQARPEPEVNAVGEVQKKINSSTAQNARLQAASHSIPR